jgi:WD40 repeat protein
MRKAVLALVMGLVLAGIVQAAAITLPSPNGAHQVVAEGNSVTLSEVATGKTLFKAQAGKGDVTALAFSPDGKILAGSADNSLLLWDAATGKLLYIKSISTTSITLLSFSADGKQLTSRDKDKVTRTYDVATRKEIKVEK